MCQVPPPLLGRPAARTAGASSQVPRLFLQAPRVLCIVVPCRSVLCLVAQCCALSLSVVHRGALSLSVTCLSVATRWRVGEASFGRALSPDGAREASAKRRLAMLAFVGAGLHDAAGVREGPIVASRRPRAPTLIHSRSRVDKCIYLCIYKWRIRLIEQMTARRVAQRKTPSHLVGPRSHISFPAPAVVAL